MGNKKYYFSLNKKGGGIQKKKKVIISLQIVDRGLAKTVFQYMTDNVPLF